MATRFSKTQSEMEKQWVNGEAAVYRQELSIFNNSLMRSKMQFNMMGSVNCDSLNNSANLKMENSSMSAGSNSPMNNNQGSANLDSRQPPHGLNQSKFRPSL